MSRPAAAAATAPGRAERLRRWLATPRHLAGAALLRLALGTLVLYQLVGHWRDRHLLWGPHGLYPLWLFERDLPALPGPSFLAVGSAAAFDALFLAGVAVAVLYLAGWQTRWTGLWFYALFWSLIRRNPLLLTGGDTLVLVMLPFLLVLDTGAYLSVDSGWRPIGQPAPPRGPFAGLLHNLALGCVFAQVALFYGFAGGYKLLGETWRAGTAVGWTARLPEFQRPGVGDLVAGSPVAAAAATWLTLAFELGVPLLLWSRRTRWLVALQAVVFHGFIAASMGLVLFSAQALAFQLPLFGDDAYRRLAGALRRLTGPLRPRTEP